MLRPKRSKHKPQPEPEPVVVVDPRPDPAPREDRPARRTSAPADVVDGIVTFGEMAKLPTAPGRVADQGLRYLEHVPDTGMDWLDTDAWCVRAVSTRGRMHRYLGEVRQDSFALTQGEGYLLLAVADGVGNEKAAHVGANLAARTAAHSDRLITTALDHGAEPGVFDAADLAATLCTVAEARGVPAQAVSTTLLVAVVPLGEPVGEGTRVTLIQIGDSPAWRVSAGEWTKLGDHADAEAEGVQTTEVAPLPLFTEGRIWTETILPGQTLALTTDGIGNILSRNPEYSSALGELWTTSAPAPGDLLRIVDATVKSFEDDRTLVAIRFSDAPA
jgi:hypothetical protein